MDEVQAQLDAVAERERRKKDAQQEADRDRDQAHRAWYEAVVEALAEFQDAALKHGFEYPLRVSVAFERKLDYYDGNAFKGELATITVEIASDGAMTDCWYEYLGRYSGVRMHREPFAWPLTRIQPRLDRIPSEAEVRQSVVDSLVASIRYREENQ